MPVARFPSRMLFRPLACAACLLTAGCGGGDPMSDSLAALGEPAAGARVDSRVPALAGAVAELEAKVAALERPYAITAAAAAGTYRYLTAGSKSGGDPAGLMFTSTAMGGNGTVTLAPNGTFTYSNVLRMSGFTARVIACGQSTDITSPANSHNHAYTRTNCTTNGFVSTARPRRESDNGAGTWRVGAGNTLVLTPSGSTPVTVYLVRDGSIGFSMEVEEDTDSNPPGTRLALSVLVKR